jgi:flagellar biosynthesis/type III secretory pathway M-ring protein FliF/YscJ
MSAEVQIDKSPVAEPAPNSNAAGSNIADKDATPTVEYVKWGVVAVLCLVLAYLAYTTFISDEKKEKPADADSDSDDEEEESEGKTKEKQQLEDYDLRDEIKKLDAKQLQITRTLSEVM